MKPPLAPGRSGPRRPGEIDGYQGRRSRGVSGPCSAASLAPHPSRLSLPVTEKATMAESTSVLAPSSVSEESLKTAEKFTFEPFVHEGEDADAVLAPGTPRRRALDDALAEVEQGLSEPSIEWRRNYSLMLGLERLL